MYWKLVENLTAEFFLLDFQQFSHDDTSYNKFRVEIINPGIGLQFLTPLLPSAGKHIPSGRFTNRRLEGNWKRVG
jgi:hypothetical protein